MNLKAIGSIALILVGGIVVFNFIQKSMQQKEEKSAASGVKWKKGGGCLPAQYADWNKAACVAGGGYIDEDLGEFGGCCY